MAVSIYVISAICGNFQWESNINPGIYEGLNVVPLTDNTVYGGYGLGQWTNAYSGALHRRTDLVLWLRANGYADDSGNGQLAYLLVENHWAHNVGTYTSLSDFLASDSKDINMLTNVWMRNWEGINSHLSDRQTYANNIYNYLLDHYTDTGLTWVTGNRYLSQSEIYNNAVLVYQYLNGQTPPEPPTPPKPPTPSDDDFLVIMCKKMSTNII